MAEQQLPEAQTNEQPLTDAERLTLETLRDARFGHPLQQKQDERLHDLLRRERADAKRRGEIQVGLLLLLGVLVIVAWGFAIVFFNVAAIAAK